MIIDDAQNGENPVDGGDRDVNGRREFDISWLRFPWGEQSREEEPLNGMKDSAQVENVARSEGSLWDRGTRNVCGEGTRGVEIVGDDVRMKVRDGMRRRLLGLLLLLLLLKSWLHKLGGRDKRGSGRSEGMVWIQRVENWGDDLVHKVGERTATRRGRKTIPVFLLEGKSGRIFVHVSCRRGSLDFFRNGDHIFIRDHIIRNGWIYGFINKNDGTGIRRGRCCRWGRIIRRQFSRVNTTVLHLPDEG